MKTINLEQAKQISFNNASVALGTFDGLHKGHIALIEAAKKHSGDIVAFTFDVLPIDVFKKNHRPMQLFTMSEKVYAFEKTGIDYMCVTHFDKDFAAIEKESFEKLIIDAFRPANIIAGYNYTYGRNAQGTAQILMKDCEKLGCRVEVIPKVKVNGINVSSTKIRELLWKGEIRAANELLGYEYTISGEVAHGRGVGRSLGFPTANLNAAKEKLLPKNGVYAVLAEFSGMSLIAVCNIGTNPTVQTSRKKSIEVHIPGYQGDLYGEKVSLHFIDRLRNEMRFESKEKLAEQIKKDINTLNKL